jgi:hypothetical protein
MGLYNVRLELDALSNNAALNEETNIGARARALDFIRYVEQIVRSRSSGPLTPEVNALQRDAATLKQRLTAINTRLFTRLRAQIRAGDTSPQAWRQLLGQYTDYTPTETAPLHVGYDGLDALINGVFALDPHPAPTHEPEAEMVHCEPTPARAILDLVDRVQMRPGDRFYDLGAGLGQVVLLVHLLSGVRARGIEVDPGYCASARRVAAELNLTGVAFVQADARVADYGDGTLFFMFTPFTGAMLHAVLNRLQHEAQTRPITLCTYGTCALHVAEQPWLRAADPAAVHPYKLAVFTSTESCGRCATTPAAPTPPPLPPDHPHR